MSVVEPLRALNLDINQQQSFIRYFRNLPEKPPTTIRIFNRTDYYTVHGEDATFASQQIFNTDNVKYMGEEPKLCYLVLSKNNFEKLVRELLLIKQYRVEVYVKKNSTQNRANNDWVLEYKGSPGDLSQFEEIIFDSNEIVYNSYVLGVKLCAKRLLGIGCVNTTENMFFVAELTDNEFFTELEAILAQLNPRECVIQQGDSPELQEIRAVIERNGILVINAKKSDFSCDNTNQDLNRLLYFYDGQKRDASVYPEINKTEAISSLQAVIKHLSLTENEQNFNQFRLNSLDVHQFVRLDKAAISALDLLPKPGVAAKTMASLVGVLDNCITPQGRRMLEQWIKQPLKDINLINERLDIVESLFNSNEVRQTLTQDYLPRIPDLLMLGRKLGSKKATLQDCYRIYQAVNNLPVIVSVLRKLENKCVQTVLVDPLGGLLKDMEKFLLMIEQMIDLELVDRGEFLIKASFDSGLQELLSKKQEVEEKMQKLLRKVTDDLDLDAKKLKLECNEQHGYFFTVTLADEHALRQNKKCTIIDAVKGRVRFTYEKLSTLNEAYSSVKESYEQEQSSIVLEVLEVAAGYADTLRSLNTALAKVDVFISLATAAAQAPTPYIRPKMHPLASGILHLEKVRHPCLEKQDGVVVIPNSVDFKKDEQEFVIITGPNMGGKSTYIRSIGCAVLLAHIGSFVPCKKAEISVVDSILARVGAEDCELKGLSTFAMEMIETSAIFRNATANSLVLIDELGRGTSTYDGCSLAYAIAEHLAKEVHCFTLFATHFNEITNLAEKLSTVCNVHVAAVTTENALTPLYQIKEGPCEKSYGVYCGRMVGLPSDVIEDAIKELEMLENGQGMKLIKDYEISLKNKVIEEGETLINQTVQELETLDTENATNEQIDAIIEKLSSADNLFAKGMILI